MIRSWLMVAVACGAMVVHAEEPAPAEGAGNGSSVKSGAKRAGSDIGDAGRKVGKEFAKAGKQVGHGTAETVKSIGHKISSDVKNKNFKPRAQGSKPKGDQGRGDDQK